MDAVCYPNFLASRHFRFRGRGAAGPPSPIPLKVHPAPSHSFAYPSAHDIALPLRFPEREQTNVRISKRASTSTFNLG